MEIPATGLPQAQTQEVLMKKLAALLPVQFVYLFLGPGHGHSLMEFS